MAKKILPFLPVLFIILLPLAFFNSAVIGRDLIILGDFSGSDLLDLHYSFKVALSEAIRHFSLPLWTPDIAMGFPLFAEGQSGSLYPPNLLLALLPPFLALNWSIILTFIIAGLGTYFYVRSLGFTRFSAFISAVVFMFSAFFITRAKHLNMIAVAAWVPFLFYFTRKFFDKLEWRYSLFLGIILALQFLAGHPQMTFFSLLVFLLYFIFEAWEAGKKHGFSSVFPLAFLCLILIPLIGLALAAVQILPTIELLGQGERLDWTLYSATDYPFDPRNLLTFISPYYFGNPALGSYRENIHATGVFWENASYIGLLPLILALGTIWQVIRRKIRSAHLLFFIGLAIFSLLMMLGRFTPVFGFLWENVPGFALFRFPTRFNLFLIFSLAILAGFGAQKLAGKLGRLKLVPPRGQPKTQIIKPGEEEFHFSWPLQDWQTQAVICGFILIDLFVFAQSYVGKIGASWWLAEPETVQFFKKDQGLYRVWSITQYGESPYQSLGWKKPLEPLVAIRKTLPPNINLEYHLPSFTDRGWFEGGLSSARRNRLERWLLNENKDEVIMGKILGLFNVKYLLTFSPTGSFEMKDVASFDLGKEFGLPLKIYENGQNMPRFYYVPEAMVAPNEELLFRALSDYKFLPTKTVLLEKEPRQVPPKFEGTLDDFKKDNPLTLKKYASTEVVIEARIKDHGFLVLSDPYYPGWKVKVDGKEKEILPADYLIRAVELTPGEHEIRFFYDPLPFKIGAGISGLTLLSLIGFGLWSLKNKKK
ncbi:MAG: YfhO family protein [bacterium]|nr:YfhO family protein [bacterium]